MSENTPGGPPRDENDPYSSNTNPGMPGPGMPGDSSVPPQPIPGGGFPAAPPPQEPYGQPSRYDEPVSVGQALHFGWDRFKSSMGTWIGALLLILLMNIVLGLIVTVLSPTYQYVIENFSDPDALAAVPQPGFLDVLLGFLAAAVSFVISSLATHGALAAVDKPRVRLADFFAIRNAGNIVLLGFVVGFISSVLSLIPGIGGLLSVAAYFFLIFSLMFVIDAGENAFAAIGSSAKLVAGSAGVVIVLIVANIGLSFLGVILCFVGLLFTLPVAYIAQAFVYRRLTAKAAA
ncbi:hypothetical protein [Paraoerskovia marina]|uniref:hypothetical protein n=1 Tax=Paraoerskovia marina TaxID=545619 RepID=UPI000492E09E|nr:hypothetical protein [Paraoerskovia marina]